MVIAWIPFVIAVIGLLIYVLSSHPKVAETGRILLFSGTLAGTLALTTHVLRLGGG